MKTILVVDDELINSQALASTLRKAGYQVVCAANGQEGLAKVKESRPDLILLDFMMPVINGGKMGQRLRATPEFAPIKVILHTSLLEGAARRQWDGYDAYLPKPFETAGLLAMVEQLLKP